MLDLVVGAVALGVLYGLPGWLLLRRTALPVTHRIVFAAAISYPLTTGVIVILGSVRSVDRVSLVMVMAVVLSACSLLPVAESTFGGAPWETPFLPVAAAAGGGAVLAIQSLQPPVIRVFDGVAVWAPFARDFAQTGELWPDWVPTLLVGFARSVGLIGGSVSMLVGGFDEAHLYLIHPIYSSLLLVTVVLLAHRLGDRRAAWVALLIMLATPILSRGVLFHDDLAAAFFITASVLLALRAKGMWAWGLVGFVAGGALSMKLLGAVALALVGTLLLAKLPPPRAWVAVSIGWLAALPWYIANAVRFGNPIYPLGSSLFGESEQIQILEADHAEYLQAAGETRLVELGVLALVFLAVGSALAVYRTWRSGGARSKLWMAALVALTALFLVTWLNSGRGSRHLIALLPMVAVVAATGLVGKPVLIAPPKPVGEDSDFPPSAARSSSGAISVASVALFVGLLSLTAWNVQQDLYMGVRVPVEHRSGVYTVLVGKWPDLRRAADPSDRPFAVHGIVGRAWVALGKANPDLKVFSFDDRWFYFPQEVLSAADERAFAVYAADTPDDRHGALRELGVGFVLDWRTFGPRHSIYDMGPWNDLVSRPDLYRELLTTNAYGLYEVIPRVAVEDVDSGTMPPGRLPSE